MLPNLRLVTAAIGLTILIVLKLGSDLITSGPIVTAGVIDRPEVRRHVFLMPVPNSPDWRTFDSLARARRSDELHRLLDLPGVTVSSYADADQGDVGATGAIKTSATFPFEPVPLPLRRPMVAAVGDIPADLTEAAAPPATALPAGEATPANVASPATSPAAPESAPPAQAIIATAGLDPAADAPAREPPARDIPIREVRLPEAGAPFSIDAQGSAGTITPDPVPTADFTVPELSPAQVELPRPRAARSSRPASRRAATSISQADKPTPAPLFLNPLSESFP